MGRRAAAAAAAVALIGVLASGASAAPSPWPTMRHDVRNTGASDVRARYDGARPWSVRTAKGIFSTPGLGADGTVFVGSADHTFLAVSPAGRVRWRIRTGGIVDAAAAVSADGDVTFGAGDELLRHVRGGALRHGQHRVLWTARPSLPAAGGQQVRWWEGNVALGRDGDLYAGNTGGGAYRFRAASGRRVWAHASGNAVWTTPAFAADGTYYWGSLDLQAFALKADGTQRWATTTLGYVVSSPALGTDGTVYVASFDGKVYALDGRTGAVRWTFQTRDHVYSSPALDERDGKLRAIYLASTDGSVYAISPQGTQLWRYDTGDVVRSSPVLGRTSSGAGRIVYVGGGDGNLYALDAATGQRRWSFDTTPGTPALADRNDLNASPALGRHAVYVAGEHGSLWSIPYNYCLHRRDARCDTHAGQPFGAEVTALLPVTAGGATRGGGAVGPVSPATVVNTRLLVRRAGATVDARIAASATAVTSTPAAPWHAALSGDGHDLIAVPDGFLKDDTTYRVRVAAPWSRNAITGTGAHVGDPAPAGDFASTITVRTGKAPGPLPLRVGAGSTSALAITRLAVPIPAFLTSVNQIGFDDYHLLAGTLAVGPPGADGTGSVLLYVITARAAADGTLTPDPAGGLSFVIGGRYRGSAISLERSDLTVRYEFGTTPQRRFALRGTLGRDLRMAPDASLYTEVHCADAPGYGPLLLLIGLCNEQGDLIGSGTFLTAPYMGAARARPAGLSVASVVLARPTADADGAVTATFALAPGAHWPAAIDALSQAHTARDAAGDVVGMTLTIPRATVLPARLRAYVVADVFPLAVRDLTG
jgi:outer membrane protein assembly factor BamB